MAHNEELWEERDELIGRINQLAAGLVSESASRIADTKRLEREIELVRTYAQAVNEENKALAARVDELEVAREGAQKKIDWLAAVRRAGIQALRQEIADLRTEHMETAKCVQDMAAKIYVTHKEEGK